MSSPAKQQITPFENAAIGAIGGVCEVIVDQPLVYFKNALQQGKQISFNPVVFYRGFGINAGSMAPITAIQVAADGGFKNYFLSNSKEKRTELTPGEKVAAGFLAGACSAFVSSPAELIMLRQQNSGDSFGKTIKEMVALRGAPGFYRGFTSSAIRDGGFSVGYLALADVVKKELDHKFSPDGQPLGWTTLTGGVLAGVAAAIFTHPFDTVKTDIQADFQKNKSSNLLSALSARARTQGLLSFYNGVGPRGLRVIIGVCLLSYIKTTLTNVLLNA